MSRVRVRERTPAPDPDAPRPGFPWRAAVQRGVVSLSVLVGLFSLMGAVISPALVLSLAAVLIAGEMLESVIVPWAR
jgi:hypothetical protein